MQSRDEDLSKVERADERARLAGSLIDDHQSAIAELSRVRREALDELLSQGWTQVQIAEAIGMTRARVGQLLASGPRPSRSLLGNGPLTIAVAGKYEAGKRKPGYVVSTEMLSTYERLAALAQSMNLKAEYELVPPPGMIQLNRTNLVVCGSPRVLPFVGQVLDSDPNLGFQSDDNGEWYLIDRVTGHEYRSPGDRADHLDFGYLGRLPRPDGRGTFLYLAGIHAIGTLGVGKYLEDNFEDLYREVKTRRFSVVVAAHTARKSGKLDRVEAVTPIYRHEGVA